MRGAGRPPSARTLRADSTGFVVRECAAGADCRVSFDPDDDLAANVTRFAQGFDGAVQRERFADRRSHRAFLKQRCDALHSCAFVCDSRRRNTDVLPPGAFGNRRGIETDQQAAGPEHALRAQVHIAADRIAYRVQIRYRVTEIRSCVIDNGGGAQRAYEIGVAGARRGVDRRASGFAVLGRRRRPRRERGFPCLPRRYDRARSTPYAPREEPRKPGRRFFEKNPGVDRRQLRTTALSGRRTGSEYLVPNREFRHVRSRSDDDSGQIASGKVREGETRAQETGPYLPVDRIYAGGAHLDEDIVRLRPGSGMSARYIASRPP